MRTFRQGSGWAVVRWGILALIALPMASCTPIPTTNTDYDWPAVTTLGIWPVSPTITVVLGRDGNPLTIAWNVAVVPETTPVVSLTLYPDPNFGDPNDGNNVLVRNLDSTATHWPFSGRDANDALIPAGVYRVQYVIDEGTNSESAVSPALLVVPLRFLVPDKDETISQSEGLEIKWELGSPLYEISSKLNLFLGQDPNDSNDLVRLNKLPDLSGSVNSFLFDGTVYDPNDPNDPNTITGNTVSPGIYVLSGKIDLGDTRGPFFIPAGGRLIILPDP